MSKRNDSAFYTNSAGTEVVWEEEGYDFYVVRAGEMRIHYSPDLESHTVIRYTDQLEEIGVRNDEDLEKFTALGEEMFSWVNNSWFEVYTEKDPDYFTEPLHDLEEAIEVAKTLKLEEVTDAETN
jgi:hypothetical protein